MLGSPSIRLWAGIVIAFASHGALAATTLTMTTEYPATSMPGQGAVSYTHLDVYKRQCAASSFS